MVTRLALFAVLCTLACGKGASAPDAGPDAGPDGGPDAGPPDGGPGDAGPVARVWPPADRTGYVSPIAAENQQQGDTDLRPSRSTYGARHQIEGYANRVSALAGETVQVMVNADAAGHSASIQLYRIGWYGGAGARRVMTGSSSSVPVQPACPNDATTGLVRCAWAPTFSLTIPSDAVSGLFAIKLIRDDNFATLIPLVVKDTRPADLLFQSSVTTFEAYNKWGGESLYADADDGIAGHKAVQVSFDRPYASYDGTADLLRWEALAARFLERNGYDVTYSTNLDLVREGANSVQKRGAFLSVGHDEYWPIEERPLIDAARDAGMPLLFLTANPAYWRTRLSAPGIDGNARVITCYKQYPQNDPMVGTPQATGRFRDAPFNDSEEKLVGVGYDSYMLFGQPWTVDNGANFVYAGTGLSTGDTIPNLVGYEYDRTFDHSTPSPVIRLARSPITDVEGRPGLHESTLYLAPAMVFGAGTIYWSVGLDGPLRDPRVERMTANLIHGALPSVPVPDGLQSVTGPATNPPQPSWASSVQTIAQGGDLIGPAGVAQLPDGSLVVADARANRIFSVSAAGAIAPFAGDGNPTGSSAYDNRPGLTARFFGPAGVLADSGGNVYVADTHNHVIRKIANDANHTTTTLAGTFGYADYADGTGAAAHFNQPIGLAWQEAAQQHLLVADSSNGAIRVVTIASGAVTTLAIGQGGSDSDGPGLNTCGATDFTCQAALAHFQNPTAVAAAPDGRVFFVASYSSKVKVVGTDGAHTVTSLTNGGGGFQDGAGTTAKMLPQQGLVYAGGALYVSDTGNLRIRKIVPGTDAASTTVTTWAGNGKTGSADGAASSASIGLPLGLFAGSGGTVYVIDSDKLAVRAIHP
jgi:hypothetical protein